jgi:hypothetical protein
MRSSSPVAIVQFLQHNTDHVEGVGKFATPEPRSRTHPRVPLAGHICSFANFDKCLRLPPSVVSASPLPSADMTTDEADKVMRSFLAFGVCFFFYPSTPFPPRHHSFPCHGGGGRGEWVGPFSPTATNVFMIILVGQLSTVCSSRGRKVLACVLGRKFFG